MIWRLALVQGSTSALGKASPAGTMYRHSGYGRSNSGVCVRVVSSTGGQKSTVTSASRRTGTRSGPDRICSLVSITTAQPDTQALYISGMLPSYPSDEVSEVASMPGRRSK